VGEEENISCLIEMIIAGLQKVSLIDYPGQVACVIFTYGCNFRCKFCHNPDLVIEEPQTDCALSQEDFLEFLDMRRGRLDGVVITGGEPLLNSDLKNFIFQIKSKGFLVKLDTNGSFSEELGDLLKDGLLDYVAMDVKTSLRKYPKLTTFEKVENISKSIKIIMDQAPDYEFRGTVVKGIHTKQDIEDMAKLVKGAKRFAIQNFDGEKTISGDLGQKNAFKRGELESFSNIFKKYVGEVLIRNLY